MTAKEGSSHGEKILWGAEVAAFLVIASYTAAIFATDFFAGGMKTNEGFGGIAMGAAVVGTLVGLINIRNSLLVEKKNTIASHVLLDVMSGALVYAATAINNLPLPSHLSLPIPL